MELLPLFSKELFAATKAAKNFLRHTSQLLKRPICGLSGGLNSVLEAISEDHRGTRTRWRPFPFFEAQMVLREEFMRLEGLANQRHSITEANGLLHLAHNDAHRALMARSGGLDIFAACVIANSIRVFEWHKKIIQQD